MGLSVGELIDKLKELPPELPVVAWDDEMQVVDKVAEVAAVRLGRFGHNLTLGNEGEPALLILTGSQDLERLRGSLAEMEQMMAGLERPDPAANQGGLFGQVCNPVIGDDERG